jgi:hypothetical protein
MAYQFTPKDFDFDSVSPEHAERRLDGFYRTTYRYIQRHVSGLRFDGSQEDRQNAGVALALISSWMGRGAFPDIERCMANYESILPVIQALDAGGELSVGDLEKVKAFCNEKVVAASKFLHFRYSRRFPIWDRKVADACGQKKHEAAVESCRNYLAYAAWLSNAAISAETVQRVSGKLGLNSQDAELRCKEFLLFSAGVTSDDDTV